ncbi:Hint domain-containing protein [Roseovarius halotolerans]|uniref:Hedgehog/Intein (Hint) domain-containing protein n=1 Tax=Roseovarius halotolerans TaxID=505353 RepID=A0A1X6YI88_9RHOB|nr:Hint domain-containing protein [Roseovarius halotolerans]RKT34611.1 Hint domain-containing protein [Roseovarius halotolerans]SLN21413.1 hypothetical protein ROH8110_00765 [Roseovarius halotolerans]
MKPKTVGRISGNATAMIPSDILPNSGLMAQSVILTLEGEKPVGDVKPGDRVITRDSGTAIVTAIRARRVSMPVVRIMAGSLGHTRPERDMTLPAGQQVLIRDWRAKALFGREQALVPVERLVDGEFVRHEPSREVTVCDIEFARPHILYVDGVEVAGQIDPAARAAAAA